MVVDVDVDTHEQTLDRDYPIASPKDVSRAVMLHTWSDLGFIHWPFDPEAVQALLPPGLTVDVHEGRAWVGLVPFHCTIRPPRVPRIPWVSSFEEMNVRTYVRGPDGVPGVWFITLDAARLGAVVIARSTYGLNYFWSKMNFSRVGGIATYSCRRRWPRPTRRVGTIALQVQEPASSTSQLDRFLTARWTFYTTLGGRLMRSSIDHAPWELANAEVLQCDPDLVAACGLPLPTTAPIAHYSSGVDVRMGPLRGVAS